MRKECVAVLVDVFDPHRCDHLPHLAEDNFLSLLLNVGSFQSQQSNRRVVHDFGCCTDSDGKDAGNIHTDVFGRQCPAQRDFDLDRLQTQIVIVLDQWDNELGPAVMTADGTSLG